MERIKYEPKGSWSKFKDHYLEEAMRKYLISEEVAELILRDVWTYSNARWSDGYDQGIHDPDFTKD